MESNNTSIMQIIIKKKTIFFLFCCCLITIIFSIFYVINGKHQTEEVYQEVTLLEAIEIGKKNAEEWNPNAVISFAISIDSPPIQNLIDGNSGARRYWNLVFNKPNSMII